MQLQYITSVGESWNAEILREVLKLADEIYHHVVCTQHFWKRRVDELRGVHGAISPAFPVANGYDSIARNKAMDRGHSSFRKISSFPAVNLPEYPNRHRNLTQNQASKDMWVRLPLQAPMVWWILSIHEVG